MTGRDAGEWRLRAGCLAAALALHAALMGGAWRHPPAREHAADAALHLVMVELLPPAPPAAVPPELSQPPPPPARTQPVPKPSPKPELRPEIIPAAIDVVVEAEPEPEVLAASASAAITPAQAATRTASAPAASAAAAPAASTQQALSLWQAQLLAHLQRYRRYPRQAERQRQQGVSHVRFLVDRQGRISQPQIERASGHRLLDEETLATVRRASPVPPPPPDVSGNPVEVVVPVSFYLRRR